jgi:hypothetical protein
MRLEHSPVRIGGIREDERRECAQLRRAGCRQGRVTDRIDLTTRKPIQMDDDQSLVLAAKEQTQRPDTDRAPWLADPTFGAAATYSAAMLANPTLRATSSPSRARTEWPTLPAFPDERPVPVHGSGCSTPLPAAGNARLFVDRGVPLGLALKDGAFGSAGDLEKFIDEYVAQTASRPELKGLHEDAIRMGPGAASGPATRGCR